MSEPLSNLDKQIISCFGRVMTSMGFEHFSRYFFSVYAEKFPISKKLLHSRMDYMVEKGIFERSKQNNGNYVLISDSLESAEWRKEVRHSIENMTRDDLGWWFGIGRYSQG